MINLYGEIRNVRTDRLMASLNATIKGIVYISKQLKFAKQNTFVEENTVS